MLRKIWNVNGILESSLDSKYKTGAKLASVTEWRKEDGERMYLKSDESVKFKEGIFLLENDKSIISQKFLIYKLGKNWWYSRISQSLAEKGNEQEMNEEIKKRVDLSTMDSWYFGTEIDIAEIINNALEATTI